MLLKIKNSTFFLDLLLINILLNVTLNYGYSNMGLRVGFVIPFSQLLLLIGIGRIARRGKIDKLFIPLIIFCAYAYLRLFLDVFFLNKGFFSLRDATNYIDILNVIVLYYEIRAAEKKGVNVRRKFDHFLYIIFWFSFVYSLTSVFLGKEYIQSISPSYYGQQKSITIFGFYSAIIFWLLAYSFYSFYLIATKQAIDIKKSKICFAIGILSILFGGRTYWLILLADILFVLISNKGKFVSKFFKIAGGIILSIFVVLLFGFLTNNAFLFTKLDEIQNILLSIVGQGDNIGKINGIYQRLEWFSSIFSKAFSDIKILIFGQGFGVALTDFISSGTSLVREPHNSFVSVFARLGIIGEIIWIYLFIKVLLFFYRASKNNKSKYAIFSMFIIVGAFIMCNTEPFFESSYCAVPFYGLIGCTLYFTKIDIYKSHYKASLSAEKTRP